MLHQSVFGQDGYVRQRAALDIQPTQLPSVIGRMFVGKAQHLPQATLLQGQYLPGLPATQIGQLGHRIDELHRFPDPIQQARHHRLGFLVRTDRDALLARAVTRPALRPERCSS